MPNVRIKDVAKHAGVSEATITRVVNNKGYVAEKTRKKVLKSIEILEYIPNRMASALKSRRTGIIGNVLPLSLDNPFFSKIAVSLKNAALKYDYQILPMYHEQDKKLEDRLLQEAISRMAEGIIFTADIQSSPKAISEVLNKQIPVIMIERPLKMNGVDKVLLDDFSGSIAATEKFLEFGHKAIGFIGKELRSNSVEINRFSGYKHALEKNGVLVDEKLTVLVNNYTVENGYDAMKQIIRRSGRKKPTACLIASDTLVCGALQYLYDARLRVPEDISIIGYDNTLSTLCSPPITSVALPYDEIGSVAISLFLERREQNRNFDKTIQLSPYLLDRGSVLDLRKSKGRSSNKVSRG
ncbi:LacI family DNA-binding transcriptional regulator [Leadbettera azotonutricia]|uniref:Transcriptional regulator n=1 Tax=Leadbettera azotonutricia (strain ATCC BAA-888 / DSM 13862 / ZAS-9) TaxID=545695 RepID=F5YD99_LEAAZ|nr:LacI family DNA-binding transcriptional regulator [Leadbettera azotonutricia]AEF80160.1 transcriptional regulator [Leadbettera azotonutricia ZAS-9]